MEERTRLLNILDSIGNYILVLDDQGHLNYSNKSIEGLLGVSNNSATKGSYSQWLRLNKQLVFDITAVR